MDDINTSEYLLQPFNQIKVRGPIDLRISQAPAHNLRVQAPVQLIPQISVEVHDGCLELKLLIGNILNIRLWRHPIQCFLEIEQLSRISTWGSSLVTLSDFDMDELEMNLRGRGEFIIRELTANHLDASINGAGRINVAGDIEDQRVAIRGKGDYIADQLISDYCHINITGSGSASVSVKEVLDALIFGSGVVRYQGYPDIRKNVFGGGRLVRERILNQASRME